MVKGADDDARYADVYLLLLRHCPEELSDQFYLYLARKAVKGFRERLEEGDLRAKHLLDEATNLLQAIQNDLDEDPAE